MGKWEMVRLGDVCSVLNGYAFQSQNYIDDGYRVVRITNVQKGVIVDDDPKFYGESSALKKYELYSEDLLVSLTGNVGRVGLINSELLPAYLNQRVACLREKSEAICKRYLFSCLNSDAFEIAAISSSKGLAQKNMSTEWLKEYTIPLPPLEVQRQIADVLDRASALIEKRKAQIDKLDLLVKSQFIEMFGDPVTNPKGWEKAQLRNYITFLTSGSRGWSEFFSDDGEMFLTIKNVKDSRLLLDNIQYVKPPKTKEAQRTRVQDGDLLISITADLGRTAVVPASIAEYGAYINQHISLVRLDKKRIAPLFVSYCLESQAGKRQFQAKNQEGVKSGLNFDAINSLEIFVPPLSVQNEFTTFVERVETQKSLLQQSLAKLELNNKSLMQKCFQGEIF